MLTVVALNAGLVVLAVGVGWHSPSLRDGHVDVWTAGTADMRPGDTAWHASQIFRGNVRVAATLLGGACTLGLSTLRELLWNAVVLGFGLSSLTRSSPEFLPRVLRYVLLEFAAFVLAASAGQHLSFMVLRCLAAGETPRFNTAMLALMAAVALLGIASVIEADVARLVANTAVQYTGTAIEH